MEVSKNFILQEFIHKHTYDTFQDNSIWFIDNRIITIAQAIRDHFGKPMLINDWHLQGRLNNRGFRPPGSDVGAKLSQHRFGRALDFNVLGLDVREVYHEIKGDDYFFKELGITAMENIKNTPSWVHVDIRFTGRDKLFIFTP